MWRGVRSHVDEVHGALGSRPRGLADAGITRRPRTRRYQRSVTPRLQHREDSGGSCGRVEQTGEEQGPAAAAAVGGTVGTRDAPFRDRSPAVSGCLSAVAADNASARRVADLERLFLNIPMIPLDKVFVCARETQRDSVSEREPTRKISSLLQSVRSHESGRSVASAPSPTRKSRRKRDDRRRVHRSACAQA